MKDEARKPTRRAWALAFISSFILHPSSLAAPPTQDDILRGISQGMNQQTGDSSKLLAMLAAAGGLAVLLVVLGYRRQRELSPKGLNHHGKLLKEMCKAISLKPAELRQLKLLAEHQELGSPLTLLLCPSLLARAAQEHPGRVDHASVAAIARKLAQRR
jgi:hypothetical protein